MNTITFYSYKGGVGRTLALANVARYLALLGKRVVCADFDFEAPGLHYKFGVPRERIPGGTVDLVSDFLRQHSFGGIRIEDLAIEVDVGDIRGAVLLLAAGSAPSPAYWSILGGIDWHRLFFDGRQKGRPPGIELFLGIQQQIEEVLQPDYLLIDARTGITEVGGVALSLLADAVVCVLAHNRENLDGARSVLRSVQAAPRLVSDRKIRLLPALSRIPTDMEPGEEEGLVESVLSFLNEPTDAEAGQLSLDRVFILHSEPQLQVHEALKVPEAGAVEASTLLRDYLALFRELIPREDVADGLEPLLARARQRAFEDPDAAQGEVESLALLYPARETALAQIQLYILRNLSPDRLLAAAKRLYEVVGKDPHEPALLAVVRQHHEQIKATDGALLKMALNVWEAQAPENSKLAAGLVKKLQDPLSIRRVADLGLLSGRHPEVALAVAVIEAFIRGGDPDSATALAEDMKSTLGREASFLEARVTAVVALEREEAAAALADELEPLHERLTKPSWTRLLVAAGRLSGPSRDVLARLDDYLTEVNQVPPDPQLVFKGEMLLQELVQTGSEELLLEPLVASKSRGAAYVYRRLRRLPRA